MGVSENEVYPNSNFIRKIVILHIHWNGVLYTSIFTYIYYIHSYMLYLYIFLYIWIIWGVLKMGDPQVTSFNTKFWSTKGWRSPQLASCRLEAAVCSGWPRDVLEDESQVAASESVEQEPSH